MMQFCHNIQLPKMLAFTLRCQFPHCQVRQFPFWNHWMRTLSITSLRLDNAMLWKLTRLTKAFELHKFNFLIAYARTHTQMWMNREDRHFWLSSKLLLRILFRSLNVKYLCTWTTSLKCLRKYTLEMVKHLILMK